MEPTVVVLVGGAQVRAHLVLAAMLSEDPSRGREALGVYDEIAAGLVPSARGPRTQLADVKQSKAEVLMEVGELDAAERLLRESRALYGGVLDSDAARRDGVAEVERRLRQRRREQH